MLMAWLFWLIAPAEVEEAHKTTLAVAALIKETLSVKLVLVSPQFAAPAKVPVPPEASSVMVRGSKSHVPTFPKGASAFTCPVNEPKRSFPDVSTNPPSPEISPPLAKIVPLKRVSLSAQRITRPPSPVVRAFALMIEYSSIVLVKALRMSPPPLYSPPIKTVPPPRLPDASMWAPNNSR